MGRRWSNTEPPLGRHILFDRYLMKNTTNSPLPVILYSCRSISNFLYVHVLLALVKSHKLKTTCVLVQNLYENINIKIKMGK